MNFDDSFKFSFIKKDEKDQIQTLSNPAWR